MAHLKGIGLKNFRIFKEQTDFEFAPITVLTGTNNSGKSSVIKAILLIDENKESINENDKIDFEKANSQLNMPNFSLIKNDKSEEDTFEISFSVEDYLNNAKLYFGLESYKKTIRFDKYGNLEQLILEFDNELVFIFGKGEYSHIGKIPIEFYRRNADESYFGDPEFGWNYQGSYIIIEPSFISLLINKISEFLINSNEDSFVFPNRTKGYRIGPLKEFLKYEIKEEDLFLLKDNLVIKKELLESALNSFDNITDFLNEINMLIISLYSMYYIERFMPVISDTLNDFDNMNKQLDIFFNRPDKYKKSIGEEFEEFEKYLSLISNRFSDDETLESLLKYLSENTEEESYKELLTLYNNYLPYCGGIKINDLIKPEFNRLFSYTVEKLINIPIVPIGLPFVYLNAIKSSNERFIDFNGPKTKFMELIQRVVNNPKNLKKIKEFADKWLQEFEIGNKIDFDITRKPYHKKMEGVIIKITKNDNVYELSDLGFGASQIVTILLTIVTNFYENIETDYRASLTYAIEEPETNLHPKLQSKLADLFVEAIKKFRCQFIIETHSEYLIRKLQYLTAKKTLKPEDTVIYYFTEPEKVTEGRKQVERINILEDGNLDNDFGPGFFDEATNLKFDLLRLKNTQKN